MADIEVTFEREGQNGVVAVGSYIGDAARRFGITLQGPCNIDGIGHGCEVEIIRGEELLSPLTTAETEHFSVTGRKNRHRLACQARIERPGEIVVMTKEKKEEEPKTETQSEQYRKEFSELPLEKKIADLVQLEAIALGDTFSYIINSPLKVFEKVGDMMAEFGMKLETEAKKATRPEEHKAESGTAGGTRPSTKQTRRKKTDRS